MTLLLPDIIFLCLYFADTKVKNILGSMPNYEKSKFKKSGAKRPAPKNLDVKRPGPKCQVAKRIGPQSREAIRPGP